MVRRVFPTALLPALLALGSCTFFAFSLFPGFLSQTEASVDLSARIEAFIDGRSNPLRGELFVLRGGAGTEFPCLLLHLDYASDRTLFVFDADLNLRKQHSYTSLDWLHLLDAKGDFVIGRLNFDDTTWNYLNGYYGSIDGNDVWRPGFSDGIRNFVLYANWSSELSYRKYDNTWNPDPLPIAATLGPDDYELSGVFHDPVRLNKEAILVLRTNIDDREAALVVRTAEDDYAAGLTQPILSNYPSTAVSDVDPNRVYYTQAGIAAADYEGRITLYGFDGAEIGTLSLGSRKELWLAFDLAGAHFYCFSLEDRLLYKGRTGW